MNIKGVIIINITKKEKIAAMKFFKKELLFINPIFFITFLYKGLTMIEISVPHSITLRNGLKIKKTRIKRISIIKRRKIVFI